MIEHIRYIGQGQDSYLFMRPYVLEGNAIINGFLKSLWLPKNVRYSKYSYLQALLKYAVARYVYVHGKYSKIIETWTYLKANRFCGDLYTL